jgi:stringent starvation protein B
MSRETTAQRPYLLRAMHAWMSDNGQTPHIVVDATVAGLEVPLQYVRDGKIVLNISFAATSGLDLGNAGVAFSARFSGTPFSVRVPMPAILGIYARETGKGMIFSDEEFAAIPDGPPGGDGGTTPSGTRRANLKVVK